MPFKDSKEGQTHSFQDGCGEPAHNVFCPECEELLKPALECKNDANGTWDGHTYHCSCQPELFVSIG